MSSESPEGEIRRLERKPRRGDLLEVRIAHVNGDGEGVARWPVQIGPAANAPRRVLEITARKALPGDRVEVYVEQCRRNVVTCRVERWLERTDARVEPRCVHFGRREIEGQGCGGCTLQNWDYAAQLAFKRERVARLLDGAGVRGVDVRPTLGADPPWFTRNKMEFSFGDDRQRRFALGMFPKGYRKEVLSLDACWMMSPVVSDFVPAVRAWAIEAGMEPFIPGRGVGFLRTMTVRECKRTGERLVELTTSHAETTQAGGAEVPAAEAVAQFQAFAESWFEARGEALTSLYWTVHRAVKGERTRLISTLLAGAPVLREALHLPGGHVLRFEIHPRAFFQPSTLQAECLYRQVVHDAGLGEGSGARVLDLYCGTGTIGLSLSPYAGEVVGVELQPDAVDNARRNAALNAITNARFVCGDVGEALASPDTPDVADVVVVDPPRAGLQPKARALVAGLKTSRLVYVSCNPVTLARDLAALTRPEVGYSVASLQPVDQFPHTAHIESVVVLQR